MERDNVMKVPIIRDGDPVIVSRDDGYYVEVWGADGRSSAGPTTLEVAKKVAENVAEQMKNFEN
jgi:hypothetical protein